jgi:hypothetical protein
LSNADQDKEMCYPEHKKKNIELLWKLSNGIAFSDYKTIKYRLGLRFLKAYLDHKTKVEVSYKDGFDDEPLITEESRLYIDWNYSDTEIKDMQDEKNERTRYLNEMKEKGGYQKNFREQLLFEMAYEPQILLPQVINKFKRYEKLLVYEKDFFENFLRLCFEMGWRGRIDERANKYFDFLCSFYNLQCPYIYIYNNITTYILLNRKFTNGDLIDTINASAFLPFCNYYITDKSMENCMKD